MPRVTGTAGRAIAGHLTRRVPGPNGTCLFAGFTLWLPFQHTLTDPIPKVAFLSLNPAIRQSSILEGFESWKMAGLGG